MLVATVRRHVTAVVLLALAATATARAEGALEDERQSGSEAGHTALAPRGAAFTFARVEYDSVGGYGESYYFYDDALTERSHPTGASASIPPTRA
jgi:hypothetical protein